MDGAAAAQTFLSNAGKLLSSEYKQLRGVGAEVGELRDELDAINALLIMQSEAEDRAVDRFLHVCMRQLREVAYDAEDCIDLYKLRISSRPGDGVCAWLRRLLATLPSRRRLSCEIRALRRRTLAISERQARFGVNRDALCRSPPLTPTPMTTASTTANNNSNHRRLVGIDDQANALVAQLKAPVGEEAERMAVFSIVGFGGLGKTTLAMEVCRRLEAEFPWQAMVSVSQAFEPSRDLKMLLKDLLQQVVKPKTANDRGIKEEAALGAINDLDVNGLAKKLDEHLADKRYLIVIDDVWTIRAWETIQSKLPKNNKGSRVLMTTRIETVAAIACNLESVGGHCIHKMQPLNPEDSKKLFLSRVFGSMDDSYPEEFGDVMGDILKKCCGLPLAIVSIASVLVGYKSPGSKEKWDRVCKSLGSQMEIHPTLEGMKHIVTLSYNHLPHDLKSCMMYFSIFPEDYLIRKDRLLNRWMAEGLVHQKQGLTMWEVAESYLEELLSRNMIEEVSHLEGHVWMEQKYKVHDMLLEVMASKSLEANFLSLHGGQYKGLFYDKIRRLSIHSDIESVDFVAKSNVEGRQGEDNLNMRHARSLSMFQFLGQQKLLKKVGNFVLLRVLDLEGCEDVTNKHVRYACNLYLLRFLSLRSTNISKVPRQIQNLEHLQTLNLGRTFLSGLPSTVTKLEKLEYIQFSNKYDDDRETMWTMPPGINKMKALRWLRSVCLGNDSKVAQEVGELEKLQDLELFIKHEVIDEEVLKELALSISKMHSLRRLSLGRHGSGDAGNILNFLHHLPTPPRLLRTLWIKGNIVDGLPCWIGSLTHLVTFKILDTALTGDQLFGILCKLRNLKSLSVYWESNNNHDELVARTSHKFPVLRDLILGGYPKVIRFEEGSMSMLETLKLRLSTHLSERSIVGIEHLTNLKRVTVEWIRYDPNLLPLQWLGDNSILMDGVLEQLKAGNDRRSTANQFQISVKYS